ncbi:metallophosphoesterase family protein [Paenibacillus allorhizosphaerae]|uniref:3',5'-cyclic adenosine monophosphate phosphodiesterase CpdA n=1 Tax=Paenibacillus allorhizosphaerae TaxID=2849866 RepID=A0ABN7TXE8_9BACL|nr:metallophosphoesterase family protein [Paenibacillus allorhizosphaerae]CAG7659101.1 3',5'-cyclic adenosine monophosphate phosphodiesterase CpdA [Paenibacillus allorhizosphaerae]
MKHKLSFRDDHTFTITQFTDIHWKEGGAEDQQSRRLMEAVLDAEKPDLVVFTGDVIYTGNVSEGTPLCERPAQALQEAVHAAEFRGIPWAIVFGNHDTENRITRKELMDVVTSHEHTVSQHGLDQLSGVGNYTLHITGSDDLPAAALYFFDSGAYSPVPNVPGYDWIRGDQIQWYANESRKLRARMNGRILPALAFLHIPLPEYKEVWETTVCFGNKFEDVCCAKVNSGLFASMVEMGDVLGTFAGHDHTNDFWGELHGIRLCYGRATGYNTYGKEGFPRGARMIRLREGERSFETWLRLANNSVISLQPEHHPNV